MSRRIEEFVEVVRALRQSYEDGTGAESVSALRIDAMNVAAHERGVKPDTIRDKFVRQFGLNGVAEFDELLSSWLARRSDTLKQIALQHSTSPQDRDEIENAFYVAPEADVLLAQEFQYDAYEQGFTEGKQLLHLHLRKERSRVLVERAKATWRAQDNGMRCAVCSFSFQAAYGNMGQDFIECHHMLPVASLKVETEVYIDDLTPVCSNCHSMLHRRVPGPSVEQLRSVWQARVA